MLKAIHGREGKDGKKFWTTVGVAFKNENGSIGVNLSYIPLPDKEGRVSFLLVEESEGARERPARTAPQQRFVGGHTKAGGLDDEIPF